MLLLWCACAPLQGDLHTRPCGKRRQMRPHIQLHLCARPSSAWEYTLPVVPGLMFIRPLRPALFTEAAVCTCRQRGSCLLSLQETPPQTQIQLACTPRPFRPRSIRSLSSVGQSRRMYLQSSRTTAKPCTCMRQALSSGAPFRSVKGCTAFTQVCAHF